MSIAPTGSISNIVKGIQVGEKNYIGVSGGVEPIFALYYTRRTESFSKNEFYKVFHSSVQAYIDKMELIEEVEAAEKDVEAAERVDEAAEKEDEADAQNHTREARKCRDCADLGHIHVEKGTSKTEMVGFLPGDVIFTGNVEV